MTAPPTRFRTGGAAIGALILTCFGTAWAYGAILNQPTVSLAAVAGAAVPQIALTWWAIQRIVRAGRLGGPEDPDLAAREGRAAGRTFGVVLGIEVLLIALSSIWLSRAGKPLLIPVAVAGIVGAHFIPLARTFHIQAYAVAGWLLVGVVLASLAIPDPADRDALVGIATALILWLTAAVVLRRHTGP